MYRKTVVHMFYRIEITFSASCRIGVVLFPTFIPNSFLSDTSSVLFREYIQKKNLYRICLSWKGMTNEIFLIRTRTDSFYLLIIAQIVFCEVLLIRNCCIVPPLECILESECCHDIALQIKYSCSLILRLCKTLQCSVTVYAEQKSYV